MTNELREKVELIKTANNIVLITGGDGSGDKYERIVRELLTLISQERESAVKEYHQYMIEENNKWKFLASRMKFNSRFIQYLSKMEIEN